MNREKITKLMGEYEDSHPVESYVAYGWRVWPAIRMYFCLGLHSGILNKSSMYKCLTATIKKKIYPLEYTRLLALYVISLIKKLFFRKHFIFQKNTCDIVIITYSTRTEWIGGTFYNYLADPLIAILNKLNKRTVIIDLGPTKTPCYERHIFCRSILDIEYNIEKYLYSHKSIQPPKWFNELKKWSLSTLNYDLSWVDLDQRIRQILIYKRIFKSWFNDIQCANLIIDYWYGPIGMGASLAAKENGIKSIDLQHGLQGNGHFAYSNWKKCPKKRYDVFPENFMVWGNDDAENLLKVNNRNLFQDRVSVVGNLWMNRWKEKESNRVFKSSINNARSVIGTSKKVIIVTLQKEVPYKDELLPLLSCSPSSWMWFIRLHRSMKDQIDNMENEFASIKNARVNIREATLLPLYALFKVCDCHITWFSTCAIEAAAFGIPTVLLHQSGIHAFNKYIQKGIMISAVNEKYILGTIEKSFEIQPDKCRIAASSAFAYPTDMEKRIGKLLHEPECKTL